MQYALEEGDDDDDNHRYQHCFSFQYDDEEGDEINNGCH